MTPDSYLATVEAITRAPLSPREAQWAFDARLGDIEPEHFACWINLTKNPSLPSEAPLPLGARHESDGETLPVLSPLSPERPAG